MFSDLDYTKKLEAAGVPRQQAETHAELLVKTLTDHFATKTDLKNLESELRKEVQLLRHELSHEMKTWKSEVIAHSSALEANIWKRQWTFSAWLIGTFVTVAGLAPFTYNWWIYITQKF